MLRADTTEGAFGPSRVAGTAGVEALVIDLDGHIMVCHSEKELLQYAVTGARWPV